MTALARLSLANRSLVIMIALVLSGVGVFAIPQLNQQLLPSLSLPMVSVVATYPGASPEIVEQQVTEPIEAAIQGLDGVEEITSTSAEGLANIRVSFDYDMDTEKITGDIESAVGEIESRLPADTDPRVVAGSTDDLPIMALAVSGGEDEAALKEALETSVVPELEGIADVKDVAVTGAREERVVITPDAAEMAAAGVSPATVIEALRSNGVAMPAGSVVEDGRELTVQVGAQLTSLEDIESIHLTPSAPPSSGQQPGQTPPAAPEPVALGDVATVELVTEDATAVTRTNGEPSLGLSITMLGDGNAVAISHEVRDLLPDLTAQVGADAEMTVIFDQAPYVERSIEDLTTEGALGLIFAVIVIMVFLLSLRSTLVTAVSIPLSVVIALISLWVGDYSLNMLTLGALTISIGRVVDDSIVVLENIKRHLGYGEAKSDAVVNGVREVAGAVTSSTLTTVAVFLPIALVGGMVGELFSSFAVTVTVALLASLLVSLTVIPVLAYWFLRAPRGDAAEREAVRREAEAKELRSPLQRMYVPVLRFATRYKLVTVLIGLVVLGGTMALAPNLKTNFLDSSGQDTTAISQTLPTGTDLATTDAAAAEIEQVLADTEGVAAYQVNIGSGNPMFGGMGGNSHKANFNVTLETDADASVVEEELRDRIGELSDVGEVVVGMQAGAEAMGGNGIEVIVQGGDAESLAEATALVESAMSDITELRDVSSNLADAAPRIEVTVDRQAAAEAGLSEAAIGQYVAQAFQGAPVGEIAIDGTTNQIVLSSGDAPADVSEIEELRLATATGMVELSDVAEVAVVDGPTEISRIDGERSAAVTAGVDPNDLGAVSGTLTERLAELDLPAGTDYRVGGSSADQQEAFADLGLAMAVAVALVFMIMVATFRSFVQPLILLVSIPFAATGALGLLLVTDTPLGVPAMIGLLMLIGIVVTNAIVLIDLINQYRAQGMGIQEAVIAGGRRRLRPILMTAIATIFALIPMAIGLTGSGGFIAQDLAIVVIGGLVSSTLLTLLLVPTLYAVVERTKERFRRKPVAPAAAEEDVTEEETAPEPVKV
ncbi:HAE1 family hydrophobic/amphiphilic exporter-1 [Stackebrandtia albiflava]|uniref:HAE1 family hydrophobic/amphiphilic exporter-1 n=1 Tax=Stackebrandtia albiflava TaxID=406432 RepID=A0A562VDN9_9ACTN|nr:efflux RND transporter permease subunit [Stackebrandtia albiflava]TWJ15994.1 HAE1 family hydrophobic/amphiphilic exporter-1 [Stackebrandtia albiflava]